MPFGQWEWQDDLGVWNPYEHSDNILVEGGYRAEISKFETTDLSFNKDYGSKYIFDYKKLTQTNTESGRVRKLRRLEITEGDDDMGFVKTVSFTAGHASAKPCVDLTECVGPLAKTTPPPTPTPASKDDDDDDNEDEPEPPKKKHKMEVKTTAASVVSAWGKAETKTVTVPTKAPALSPAFLVPSVDLSLVAEQEAKGAQSRRNQKYDLGMAGKDPHGKLCFDRMLSREKQLAGEWAVFYHSYSFAALLYEVQAAVAAVLFRFKSEFATLPRLRKAPFNEIPDAAALQDIFPKFKDRDHNPKFRAVGISGTSSLLANDSEAPPSRIFLHGYSCADLSFVGALEDLLVACGVPDKMKQSLGKQIIDLSAKYGLDVSQFKGPACKSGRAGHMLQIFIKRPLVNKYVYAALPFGVTDKKRPDLEKYLRGDGPIQGQVRIVTNPSTFMRGNAVRMYVFSADPTFHDNRPAFQAELTALLEPIIGTPGVRVKAAEGIYDGKLPAWFNAEDYEEQQKTKKAAVAA